MRNQREGTGRRIKSEAEARRCLLAARGSGLSIGDWARGRGIDGRSLRAWQMNLERRGSRKRRERPSPKTKMTAHALVELVPRSSRAAGGGGQRYVLELGGARFEFGDDVSDATLRRVLEALRPC